jgi:hypothetical protein
MWVSDKVLDELKAHRVETFYMSRDVTQFYNRHRGDDIPRAFGGWYWNAKSQEGGPFRTVSAARVNAYYIVVLRQEPPQHFQGYTSYASYAKRNVVPLRRRRG